MHAQGLFHRVCHLWTVGVRDGVPGIWLQQRQFDRPLYPGGFDLSATGHIDPGETPRAAMAREAGEEIGLQLDAARLTDGGSYRQQYARGEGNGFDDELAFAFLTRIDGVPPFRPGSEVADMAFVPLADFTAGARKHRRPDGPAHGRQRGRRAALQPVLPAPERVGGRAGRAAAAAGGVNTQKGTHPERCVPFAVYPIFMPAG